MNVERVPLDQVRDLIVLGGVLPFRVFDANARLLLGQGQCVLTARQFEALVERGAWVERETVLALRREREAAALGGAGKVPSARRLTLFDRWEQQIWDCDALLRRLVRGRMPLDELRAFALGCVALVEQDVDVALFIAVRRDDRRFALHALTHALHVATLCILSARRLGWSQERLLSLVQAALTMNLGMLELQAVLAEQPDPPSVRQREQIHEHPERAVRMLQDAGVEDAEWLAAVREHHEEPGGGGYPARITAPGEAAQVLRLADIYMARISPRATRAGLSPQAAARELYQKAPADPLANALIRSVGIYPPGDVVRLRSGEIAVVTRRAVQGPAPRVAAISNARGQPVQDTRALDSADAAHAIAGPLDPAVFATLPRLHPERFYGLLPGHADPADEPAVPGPPG